jgi:nucleoside-triphosphatase
VEPLSKNILIQGPPRVGKTTVVQKVLSMVKVRCGGFFSQALTRDFYTNFRLVTVEGPNRSVSSQELLRRFDIPGLVGFNLEDLESFGNPSLARALETATVVVIDQLGTLETQSEKFRRVVTQVLDSPKICLATMTLSNEAYLEAIRTRPDVTSYEITRANRSTLAEEITRHIHALCFEPRAAEAP